MVQEALAGDPSHVGDEMQEARAHWKGFCNTDKILQQWKSILVEDRLLLGAHQMSQIRSLGDGGFHSCQTVEFTPLLSKSIQ